MNIPSGILENKLIQTIHLMARSFKIIKVNIKVHRFIQIHDFHEKMVNESFCTSSDETVQETVYIEKEI